MLLRPFPALTAGGFSGSAGSLLRARPRSQKWRHGLEAKKWDGPWRLLGQRPQSQQGRGAGSGLGTRGSQRARSPRQAGPGPSSWRRALKSARVRGGGGAGRGGWTPARPPCRQAGRGRCTKKGRAKWRLEPWKRGGCAGHRGGGCWVPGSTASAPRKSPLSTGPCPTTGGPSPDPLLSRGDRRA